MYNLTIHNTLQVLNSYGPAETTVISTEYRTSVRRALSTGSCVPIGKPLPTHACYVLDETLRILTLPLAQGINSEAGA